ncbi:MAG: hypothetical protein ACJ74H_12050 [Thermoanaerobaculia bacterium]
MYLLALPIETNRGRGETRSIGPASVTFVISASFAQGDAVRFSLSLPDVDIFCSGSVRAVSVDGALFVVEASIDHYDFGHTKSGPSNDAC